VLGTPKKSGGPVGKDASCDPVGEAVVGDTIVGNQFVIVMGVICSLNWDHCGGVRDREWADIDNNDDNDSGSGLYWNHHSDGEGEGYKEWYDKSKDDDKDYDYDNNSDNNCALLCLDCQPSRPHHQLLEAIISFLSVLGCHHH
jgi:hypothetical protein